MYKIINEDNTIVKEYPSPEIYRTLSNEEKNNIFIFKNEIEKITIPQGLGKVSVNVFYDGATLEKEFMIKYSNGFTKEYYENEILKLDEHMMDFSKMNNLYKFYRSCIFLLEK